MNTRIQDHEHDDEMARLARTRRGGVWNPRPRGRAGDRSMAVTSPGEPPSTVRLSSREVEVLKVIASGCRSRDAASQLFLSSRTVNYHLSNIFEKLGVNNRLRAIHVAGQLGILPFEPRV